MWRHSVRLEIGGKKKTLNWLGNPHKVSKVYFFPSDYPLHYLQCYRLGVWSMFGLKIIWLESSHNPEWQLKGLSEAIWTKSLGRTDATKTQPGCWVLFKMTATTFEFWASLEVNFTRKACALEAETSVSGSPQCKVFVSVDKRYTFFGVTFSFESCNVMYSTLIMSLVGHARSWNYVLIL